MMDITYAPRDILQIDNARIVHRNFSGAESKFNRKGDRNFSLVIEDEETARKLADDGWNVKIRDARDDDDVPFMFLPVKIKFNERGPVAYLKAGNAEPVKLDEESIGILDDIDILGIDLDIRPYNWEVNGKTGRTAYLQSIFVTQEVDRFAARFEN